MSSSSSSTPVFFDEYYTPKTIAKGGCFCCEYSAWEYSGCLHCLADGEEGDDCDCGCDYPRCEESAGGCKHYLGDYIKPVAEAEPLEPQAAPAPVQPVQPPLVRVQLRRSYGVVPGQSDSDREAMIAELDILNNNCKAPADAAAAPAAAAAASPSPTKRSLDDYPDAPKKKAKKMRKKRIQAVAKTIGGEAVYELTLADGSIILARPLRFA